MGRLCNLGFFILLLFPSANYPVFAGSGEEENRTREFATWYEQDQVDFSSEEIHQLQQYTTVLIPGFLSNITIKATPVGYFQAALTYFEQHLGLIPEYDFLRLVINSQTTAEKNIALIAQTIADAPKKVLLIGHSKGALDAIATLSARPDLWGKVAGFIAIQAPFYGTPLVEQITASTPLRWAFTAMLTLFGGEMASFQEFSPERCQEKHYAQTAARFPFPFITFSSYLRKGEEMSVALLRPFHHALQSRELNNDGLIPTMSSVLPGLPYIIYRGLDHTDGMVGWGTRGRQEQFIASLLKVFLSPRGR